MPCISPSFSTGGEFVVVVNLFEDCSVLTTLDSLYVGHSDCTIRVFYCLLHSLIIVYLITIANSNTL